MELIDKAVLIERINKFVDLAPDTAMHLEDCISGTPVIDAVEVRHGFWKYSYDGAYSRRRAYCSVCGKHSGIGGIASNQEKPYCPNCGAKMDGRRESEGT